MFSVQGEVVAAVAHQKKFQVECPFATQIRLGDIAAFLHGGGGRGFIGGSAVIAEDAAPHVGEVIVRKGEVSGFREVGGHEGEEVTAIALIISLQLITRQRTALRVHVGAACCTCGVGPIAYGRQIGDTNFVGIRKTGIRAHGEHDFRGCGGELIRSAGICQVKTRRFVVEFIRIRCASLLHLPEICIPRHDGRAGENRALFGSRTVVTHEGIVS